MMNVHVAVVKTYSSDTYVWVYKKKPKEDEVIKRVWVHEGKCEPLKFYRDTTSVRVYKCEVESEDT